MRYQGIKVTLITGFLGAGKTTLIRQLLEKAPTHERWAVLVNEFGDIGLDSAFYSESGVAVKEVPGGCVCCTTSAAFQQGLNQLIRQYNPDRIFIEPSGLGHPKQIIQKLRGDSYQDVLLLTGAFCVLDARNLQNERYTKHAIFNDQIESANGIVLSHVDRYQQDDLNRVKEYFSGSSVESPVIFLSDPMSLDIEKLDIGMKDIFVENVAPEHIHTDHFHDASHHHNHSHKKDSDYEHNGESSVVSPWYYQKEQDAMRVIGWRWSKNDFFEEAEIVSLIDVLVGYEGVYRIKGVFLLNKADALMINASRGEVSVTQSPFTDVSRLEIIGDVDTDWASRAKVLIFNNQSLRIEID